MKSLRNRLIFHFSLQFICISIAIALIVVILFMLLLTHIVNEELKMNLTEGSLEGIITETEIKNDQANIPENWRGLLKKKKMWVQIINKNGRVIESYNTPSDIPKYYSISEIHTINQTKMVNEYSTVSDLDTTYEEPYYFILGFDDLQTKKLKNLFSTYSVNGKIPQKDLQEIDKTLLKNNETIHVINGNGDIIQSVGNKDDHIDQYLPLDLLVREKVPGLYLSGTSFYHDPISDLIWLHITPKEKEEPSKLTTLEQFVIATVIVGATVFILTISLSIWNGFRYGQPLLIFTSWLERMGNRQYDEVLTEKERKKIFRRNGKVRVRYRLYREVINAFYEMTERLTASEKEKQQLEKTREEWITGISHDLRTPLSSMKGYGHILESGHYDWSREELIEIGNTIIEKSDYMHTLVEDFMLTFQLKNKALPLTIELTNINCITNNIVTKFQKDRTITNTSFLFQQSCEASYVAIDKKWFERMVDNLIFNSIKHNPPGVLITVAVKYEPTTNYTILSIEDNGIGMDNNTREQLFSRYHRGTSTEEKVDGTGLGMNIAKGIAELHQATIDVETELNKGTIVKISFPPS
ncbi:signal transduction histidine kinase [Metabacillus crassostreae]|uniref:sensor histidine kinase n=1 Tax=Metabacillus crassostreae TaxID=929098 RepID=UPI00195B6814|nr:HAMP domain-containing sensor histidine kinase [Metabacillus crassostreae]MBM7603200.1 signal transduction histidine kinase [Metabacillus crassostreae]